MNEKYTPSGQLQGDISPLPFKGCGTGFQGSNHGIMITEDCTQRLGGIDASSAPARQFLPHTDRFTPGEKTAGPDFTGRIGRIDGSSAERSEENVNDADAGRREGRNG